MAWTVLETDNFLEGKRCVTNLLSVCSNAAAEKRWPGDRQQFAGGGVCHCQSVQQLRRDGLETENNLEGQGCVAVRQYNSSSAAEKRWVFGCLQKTVEDILLSESAGEPSRAEVQNLRRR